MKKILLLFCTVLVSVTASARYYDSEPDAGDWAIGLNMNSGSYYPLINFGLGTKLQYYSTSAFRIEEKAEQTRGNNNACALRRISRISYKNIMI